MNDEILPQRPPPVGMVNMNAPLIGPPPQPRRIARKVARDDLRFEIGIGAPKKKTPSPPTPTTLVHNHGQPGLVPLNQPLVNALPYYQPSYNPLMMYPQPRSASPRIVPIRPRDGQTPPMTPLRGERDRERPVVYIDPGATREHGHRRRHSISYVPVRRYRSTARREHDHRHHSPAPRGRDNNNNNNRRQDQAQAQARHDRDASEARANAIEAEIIRLRGEIARNQIERDQARRTTAREEELRRLDRRIQDLNDEVDRQVRARRLARSPVIHDDRYYDYRDDFDDDDGGRGGQRARSRSRGRNVHFDDEPRNRGRRLEDRPAREDDFPFRTTRGRSRSEIRRWNAPRGRGERVVYDDERRRPRGGGGGWF
ncbi:hypothetical protein MMC10_004687 [Thelotrema lepadinum]|nr:hypothetical protein [Thelotrema lepadinum]